MANFRVEYYTVQELKELYPFMTSLSAVPIFPECIILEGDQPFALMLSHDLHIHVSNENSLQTLVRCYIIECGKDQSPFTLSEIWNRYR